MQPGRGVTTISTLSERLNIDPVAHAAYEDVTVARDLANRTFDAVFAANHHSAPKTEFSHDLFRCLLLRDRARRHP